MLRFWGMIAVCLLTLAALGTANANDDLIRLDGKGEAEVQNTHWRGHGWGGWHGHGWGGWHGHGWGGWGWGRPVAVGWGWGRPAFWGGAHVWGRPAFWGGPRVVVAARPWGWGWNSSSVWWGTPTSSFYVAPSFSSFNFGCAADLSTVPAVTNLTFQAPLAQLPTAPSAMPATPGGDATFPYDGGPRQVLPMPGDVPAPTIVPQRPNLKRDGLLVSVPGARRRRIATWPTASNLMPCRPMFRWSPPPRFGPRAFLEAP